MKLTDFNSLFVHELKDLLNAELQLVKAMPKLAKAATDARLRRALEDHLDETKEHAERLRTILKSLGESSHSEHCPAMEGLIAEGASLLEHGVAVDPAVLDAAIIATAQRVEHYEIAAYGCARTFAHLLGNHKAETMLQETLDEEGAADSLLTDIAETQVNPSAMAHR